MSGKQRKTLAALRKRPTAASVKYSHVESLLLFLGAERSEGAGSRVRFDLGERTLILHRPHPRPEMSKGAVESVRDFLIGVEI